MSRRLPGKVLANVRGKPLLGYVLERLQRCADVERIAVATSTDPSDDSISTFSKRWGIPCYRGPLQDVASRMLAAARAEDCEAFVRISGDSPLIDPSLVDKAAKLYREQRVDLVTNVHERTFPKGQSVEVISVQSMASACEAMMTEAEREHVTPYFYSHPECFRIVSFTAAEPRGQLQLSVDTGVDLRRFELILEHLGEPHWRHGLEAVVTAARMIDAETGGPG